MNYVIRVAIFLIIPIITDILFFRFFLKVRLRKELYGLALLTNMVSLGALFVAYKMLSLYSKLPLPIHFSNILELSFYIVIKLALYWYFVPQDKRGKKLLYMVFFSSSIGLIISGVLILAAWKFL